MESAHPILVNDLVKSFVDIKKTSLRRLLRHAPESTTVLDEITFSVPKGQLLGVMGRNGAGKSTLLRLLGKVYTPDSGRISVQGEIASIFEMGAFLDRAATGRQYCMDYFQFQGVGKAAARALAEEIHTFSELGEFFDKPVRTYSSGMQAKLLFGVVTALPSDIFLIDEVLLVGDQYFQGRAWRRLCHMLEQGTTGVIVSHDWVSILRLCENTMLIKDKRVDFFGESRAAVQRYLQYMPLVSDTITIQGKDLLLQEIRTYASGSPFSYECTIHVSEPPEEGKLRIVFAFEKYSPGKGWHSALICENNDLQADKRGQVRIQLCIPLFELAPETYHLTIGTTAPLPKGNMQVTTIYEELSWLRGTAPQIRVAGKNPSGALIQRRLQWSIDSI